MNGSVFRMGSKDDDHADDANRLAAVRALPLDVLATDDATYLLLPRHIFLSPVPLPHCFSQPTRTTSHLSRSQPADASPPAGAYRVWFLPSPALLPAYHTALIVAAAAAASLPIHVAVT